jgi:hypothetical protein
MECKMAKASVKQVFNLSADQLWDLIGDFGNTTKWSGSPAESCVPSGEGIGAIRTLTLSDGRKIVDRLDAVGRRSYSYSVVTSPLPVSAYHATMSVLPIDAASCEFTWSGEFEPIGITGNEATEFFLNVYRTGIAMIEKTILTVKQS